MPQTKYKLPADLKMRCISLVRGYERMLAEYLAERENIIYESPAPSDGQPRGNQTGDVCFNKTKRLVDLGNLYDSGALRAIDQARHDVCLDIESDIERARTVEALMDSCIEGRNFVFEYRALAISKSNFYRRRQKFLYDIAKNMGFI